MLSKPKLLISRKTSVAIMLDGTIGYTRHQTKVTFPSVTLWSDNGGDNVTDIRDAFSELANELVARNILTR